ncbi:TniB family NTP-binding protein [Colwelliaceae bacterium BS250]
MLPVVKTINVVKQFFSEDVFRHPVLVDVVEQIDFVHQSSSNAVNFSLLVTGLSRSGKSFTGRRYESIHSTYSIDGVIQRPVLYVKLNGTRNPADLLNQIIEALGSSSAKKGTEPFKIQNRLVKLIKGHGVQLIFIDEIQDCLPMSDGKLAQNMAKQICRLIDEAHIPFILLGTPSAKRLINLQFGIKNEKRTLLGSTEEEQASGRFLAPLTLCPIFPRTNTWIECVRFFITKYNVIDDITDSKPLLNRIYVATEGRMGVLDKLIYVFSSKEFKTESTLLKLERAYKLAISTNPKNPFNEESFSDHTIHTMTIHMEPNTDDLIC